MHAPVGSGQFIIPGEWPGLVQHGNIDLAHRPVVKNPDGSISTVKSVSFGVGPGREVLVPQVVDGRVVGPMQALQHFQQTGQHLGVFKDPASANAYAEALHQQQARLYAAVTQIAQLANH